MPHFPHTPEALLGRNDSKNAATTCRGITSAGRACRRALASPKSSSVGRRTSDRRAWNGAVAAGPNGDDVQDPDFYCWQHKDQAEQRVGVEDQKNDGRRINQRSTELPTLHERSSIDTLVQRLGVDAAPKDEQPPPKRPTHNTKPPRRTRTNDFATQQPSNSNSSAPHAEKYHLGRQARRRPKPGKKSFCAAFCCMAGDGDDDYVEVVRHRKRVEQIRPPEMTASTPTASHDTRVTRPPPTSSGPATTLDASSKRQQTPSNAQTNSLLSLIPQGLSPQTTSALLAELIKPISPYDDNGYIYIFWLTPSSIAAPDSSTAKSLLAPRESRPQNGRRISDVMTEYSFDGADAPERHDARGSSGRNKTIMLKIGRANNITRRMNEWQRQCGYALNLVRWYPYVSSSASPGPSPQHQRPQPLYPDLSKPPANAARRNSEVAHKCPHIHRVERLIHLELSAQQVKRQCQSCKKEHREWFEVTATQEGVKAVDEVVRRWVGWAERQAES